MADLKVLRVMKRMTQQEVANKVGVSRATVVHAESGKGIALDTAKKLADFYQVDLKEVVQGG